jgi:hypothetical protein
VGALGFGHVRADRGRASRCACDRDRMLGTSSVPKLFLKAEPGAVLADTLVNRKRQADPLEPKLPDDVDALKAMVLNGRESNCGRGIPTEAVLAQIAISNYADGLPLYRQQAIYARDRRA